MTPKYAALIMLRLIICGLTAIFFFTGLVCVWALLLWHEDWISRSITVIGYLFSGLGVWTLVTNVEKSGPWNDSYR